MRAFSFIGAIASPPEPAARQSLAMLVLANLVPVFGVVWLEWSALSVVLLYVVETAVIGVMTAVKMLTAGDFDFERVPLVLFFCVHYGLFLIGQTVFVFLLLGGGADEAAVRSEVTWAGAGFLVSHGFSLYRHWFGRGERLRSTPKNEMPKPYTRIVVQQFVVIGGVHLSFVMGESNTVFVLLLVALKTVVDGMTHLRRHRTPVQGSVMQDAP